MWSDNLQTICSLQQNRQWNHKQNWNRPYEWHEASAADQESIPAAQLFSSCVVPEHVVGRRLSSPPLCGGTTQEQRRVAHSVQQHHAASTLPDRGAGAKHKVFPQGHGAQQCRLEYRRVRLWDSSSFWSVLNIWIFFYSHTIMRDIFFDNYKENYVFFFYLSTSFLHAFLDLFNLIKYIFDVFNKSKLIKFHKAIGSNQILLLSLNCRNYWPSYYDSRDVFVQRGRVVRLRRQLNFSIWSSSAASNFHRHSYHFSSSRWLLLLLEEK